MDRWKLICIFLVCLLITSVVLGIKMHSDTHSNTARIINVRVDSFWDEQLTSEVTQVDWGIFEANETKEVSFWVVNIGNWPITIYLTTEGWNPVEMENYTRIEWNVENLWLEAGEKVLASISLTILPEVVNIEVKDFNFTSIITGVQAALP